MGAAKERSANRGRRKQIDDQQIRSLEASGLSNAKIARDLGVSRMTVYRVLGAPAGDRKLTARQTWKTSFRGIPARKSKNRFLVVRPYWLGDSILGSIL
ncbi:helix-turn-helix domain-containing protein [Ruegeria hyattellae]|uniref:helix-turn-helix domain-containing protein n=1 Tax=Ruegeria hyattellae TaxID=3233337 RepID=UPI00355B8E33